MRYLIPLLLFLCSASVQAQTNLVPNGNFEDTVKCTNALMSILDCVGWNMYTSYSTGYATVCGGHVPNNQYGYQQPASGNAYIVMHDFSLAPQHWRSYPTRPINAMQIGVTYEVSLSVSVTNLACYYNNGLGVHFFDNGPTRINGVTHIFLTPKVTFKNYGMITDTANWVRLSALFVADSSYDNIIIGGFLDSTDVSYTNTNFTGCGNSLRNAIYVDSVVVKAINGIKVNATDSIYCVGDTITANYYTGTIYGIANTFTLQLSDKNGSFSSPTTINSVSSRGSGVISGVIPNSVGTGSNFRLRIVSSAPSFVSDTTETSIKIANPDSSSVALTANTPLCEGATINLSASTAVSSTTYSWVGPNSFTSAIRNPSIANAVPAITGDYIVTMNFYTCEVTDTIAVTVIPLPSKPAVTNNGALCVGDTLQLNASTTTTGVSYSWAGPNSYTSSIQNPVINNSTTVMSGVYTATVTKNGCSNNDTTNVLVKPSPTAISASTNSPLCAGDTLQLQSTASTSGVTYSWSGPNSFTAATRNSSINNSIPAMTGWYKIIADLNGCSVSDSASAVVYPVPSVPTLSYSNPICVGDSLKLFASNVNGVTYYWSGPNSFSTNTQNPIISTAAISDTGYYKIYTSANGCNSSTDSIHVQVNPTPFVVIFANKDSLCDGDAVTFTALPTNAGTSPQYQWYVNAQAVGNGANTYTSNTIKDMDVIRCDMSDATKCSASFTDPSNDVQMKVLPWLTPSVSISANPNGPLQPNEYVTFTANVTNGGNPPLYQWVRNGIDVLGATSDTWSANTLNDNDSVSVEIESSYMCPQPKAVVSNGIVVTVLTSVGDVTQFKDLKLYPNPNDGSFTLSAFTGSYKEVDLTIVNTMGQVVYTQKLVPHKSVVNEKVRVTSLPAGVYLLKLSTGKAEQVLRFSVRL